VSRGDSFYLKLADTILKDVHRTDRHVKSIKSKISYFSIFFEYKN